jgi:hypothetical protein
MYRYSSNLEELVLVLEEDETYMRFNVSCLSDIETRSPVGVLD